MEGLGQLDGVNSKQNSLCKGLRLIIGGSSGLQCMSFEPFLKFSIFFSG